MADWCSVPADILYTISLCLPTSIDILRFRSVCAAWRFAVNPQSLFKPYNPIIPDFCHINYLLWDINLDKRTIYIVQSTTLPHMSWIIKLKQDYDKNLMHLVHPLFKSRNIPYPGSFRKSFSFLNFRVKELGQEYILQTPATVRSYEKRRSVVLNDSGDGFVLLTIMSGTLAIYKSGHDKWKSMEDINSSNSYYEYDDVIVSGGKFYAICTSGKLVFVDHVNMKTSIIANTSIHWEDRYLVDCDGELMLVNISAKKFEIGRFDGNTGEWIKVCDLGDMMLFLSDHCRFFVSVSDIFGGEGNRIIVNDQRGVNVFGLESGSIEPLSHPEYFTLFSPPSHWISSVPPVEVSTCVNRFAFALLTVMS